MPTPEDKARENIDRLLTQAGWAVRDQSDAKIGTSSQRESFAHKITQRTPGKTEIIVTTRESNL